MQFVDDHWYRFYKIITTSIQAILGLACLIVWLVPGLGEYAGVFGFSWITLLFSALHLVYSFVFYPRYYRNNVLMATLILAGLFTLNIINLVHVTGQLSSLYMALWLILLVLSGTFGGGGIVGTLFLITIYFVLLQDSTLNSQNSISFTEIGALVGSYAVGAISYFLWRPKYLDRDSVRVRQLNDILNNRQNQSEVLIQSISDGVIATNAEGKIGIINKAAATYSGWTMEEAAGLDIRSVLQLQDEKGKELPPEQYPTNMVITQKTAVDGSYTLVQRADDTAKIVTIVTTPVVVPSTGEIAGCVCVIRDVSEERRDQARRADFISTASHEMRTPVAAIEGYLALALNDKISQIDTKARSYLEKAQSSTRHLGQLFQDLLTSAKAEDGRLTSHPVVVELDTYLRQLSDDLRFTAEKKGLSVKFVLGSHNDSVNAVHTNTIEPIYYTHVDPDRLREVITNVFDNAVKYTESGSVTLGLTGDEKVVQIRITDTGPGIPAEDVPHLFQKFYRVDNTATRTVGGTGLGLFIVKKIVELYHGQIWVESQIGKGSTFFINLPRLDSSSASQMQSSEAQQSVLGS